jgi:signal transduction histidine kinase
MRLFLEKTRLITIKQRRWIILLIAIYVSVFEIIEHPNFLTDNKHDFYKEIGIYYSLIFLAMVMLEIALRAGKIKNQTIRILDARHNLSMQLSAAKEWEDVVSRVLQYPASILQVSATSLLIYDHLSKQYILERWWPDIHQVIFLPSTVYTKETLCSTDLRPITSNLHLVDSKKVWPTTPRDHECYHLVLDYGDMRVGILNIFVPKHKQINPEIVQLLSKTAEDMAIGLNAAKQRQEQHAIEVANAASSERLEIARDLHDTLGQNLGYLHFKLDTLLSNNNSEFCQTKTLELMRLRDLADESYELVRNTLVILHQKSDHTIRELLNAHSQIIAKRAGFTVKVKEVGSPRAIPPENIKQLLHAYKEAIFNIEKHSDASEAKVYLSWMENQLNVRICDNGKGFDISSVDNNGHYGLHIISERIQSIGGMAEITSVLSQGTEVKLSLPLVELETMINQPITGET